MAVESRSASLWTAENGREREKAHVTHCAVWRATYVCMHNHMSRPQPHLHHTHIHTHLNTHTHAHNTHTQHTHTHTHTTHTHLQYWQFACSDEESCKSQQGVEEDCAAIPRGGEGQVLLELSQRDHRLNHTQDRQVAPQGNSITVLRSGHVIVM